ncbi:MAG: hypothetical protein LM557_02650 [Desulfurococcaceae archaeon]|nr:hypothetical protein [Desulfurococcaceae archaeon]MCC6052886.1 hypothetical protein [Desulfurococcaceae archaeon]
MSLLVDNLLKQLDTLISLLESTEESSLYKRELLELKRRLEEVKKPLIPSRSLWNKYVKVYSSIEELINTTKTRGGKTHLHRLLPSIREDLVDFTESLKKAYISERIQLSLPVIMCLAVSAFKLIEVFSYLVIAGFSFSITALLLLFYSPQIGLIVNSTSGLLIAAISSSISDVLLGLFLSAVSITYVIVVSLTGSHKFTSRLEELVKSISMSVELELKRESMLKTESITCLVKKYTVDPRGFLAYADHEELLKYKATVLLIHGQSACTSPTTLISESTTVGKEGG